MTLESFQSGRKAKRREKTRPQDQMRCRFRQRQEPWFVCSSPVGVEARA